LFESDEKDNVKQAFALAMFFGDIVYRDDIEGLVKHLGWYLAKGKEEKEEDENEERTFDLLIDAGKIFSAFMQVYHINLRTVKMHWWVFLELLEGLPSGTYLSSVIELRGKEPDKNMSAKDRVELAKAQDHHRIGVKEDIFGQGLTRGMYGR